MKGGMYGWFGAAAVAALLAGVAAPAGASCNFTPDAGMFFASGNRGAPPDGLPYRGRIGRASRAVFVPGVTKSFEVGTDPFCKTPPLAAVAKAASDLAAILLYRNEGGAAVHAHVYGSDALCTPMTRYSAGPAVCDRTRESAIGGAVPRIPVSVSSSKRTISSLIVVEKVLVVVGGAVTDSVS